MTKEQFALWSFERDRRVGLYPRKMEFSELPQDEQKTYLDEAEYYITSHPRDDWPIDILERFENVPYIIV